MADWANRGRTAVSCIAAAAAVACGAGATAAPASRSSGVELLTYAGVHGGLCAMRPDGSHRVRLLSRSLGRIFWPTWSADGRYVAFEEPSGRQIVVADSRGRVRRRIKVFHHVERAWWSPDGQHIAYRWSWSYGYGLAIVRSDGFDTHVVPSPNSPALGGTAPGEPAWTPDGQRLAFDDGGIYSVRVDGGDRRLLVANGAWPAFSPDGSKLAYVARSGGNFGIDIADADGSSPQALALSIGPGGEWNTAWSPNGTLLAFSRGGTDPRDVGIVVADPDGSSERVIPSAANSDPAWSPDSKLIAFVGNQDIVVARADGGGERVVLRSAEDIAWRPATPLPPAKRSPC